MKNLLPVALGVFLFAACNNSETKEESTSTDTMNTQAAPAQQPVELADVSQSPDFAGASLTMGNVTASAQGDSAKVSFNFNVKNYELKNQTSDAGSKLCNNSDKGQHIHFILDNQPYVALYEPKHDVVLAKNTEHTLMAFLSRSYHESLKSKGAALVYTFKIDANGKLQKTGVPKTPMVFYSRPKGDYLGKDVENVLFDFYVWNTELSQDGYKVKAHLTGNGVDTTFVVNQWKAMFLKHLPMGKQSITLTLVDKDGNKVDGPETEVTREYNLSHDEPMAK